MREIKLYIWTDASQFREDRSLTRWEMHYEKEGKDIGSRSDQFISDQTQQGAILEGMIASLSRINDGSGLSLIVICPNSNIICSINQKQYETWSEHKWINARGKEVKHSDKWQRVRELIHKKLSDITARAPSQEDEAIMHKLGAEKIQQSS